MKPAVNKYFMEDPREAARVAAKVEPASWVQKYLAPDLGRCRSVLDVGCGPGVIAADVARSCPECRVIGIDQSKQRTSQGPTDAPANLELRVGDACALPFDDGSFDLVYSRFMLEYLPEPQRAVQEMARVCRPGGHVLLQDLDGQLLWHYPIEETLFARINRVVAALAETGFDPFIGRKLYHFAYSAKLTELSVAAESYHLYPGPIDPHNFQLWELKLDIAMPTIARALESEQAAQDLKRCFLDYLMRDDSLTYSIVFTVRGTKP